jgi:hypothetical protein
MIPEETFNSQRRGRQIAEICSYRLPEVPGSSPRLPQSSPPEAPRSFERLLEASGKLASESSQKFPEACRSSQKLSEGSKKAPRGSPEGAGSVGKLPQAAKSSPMLSEASDAPERFLERSQRFPESFPTGKKKVCRSSVCVYGKSGASLKIPRWLREASKTSRKLAEASRRHQKAPRCFHKLLDAFRSFRRAQKLPEGSKRSADVPKKYPEVLFF